MKYFVLITPHTNIAVSGKNFITIYGSNRCSIEVESNAIEKMMIKLYNSPVKGVKHQVGVSFMNGIILIGLVVFLLVDVVVHLTPMKIATELGVSSFATEAIATPGILTFTTITVPLPFCMRQLKLIESRSYIFHDHLLYNYKIRPCFN